MNLKTEQAGEHENDLAAKIPTRSEQARKERQPGNRKTEFRLTQEEFDRFAAAARQRHGDKKGAMIELFVDMLELLKIET